MLSVIMLLKNIFTDIVYFHFTEAGDIPDIIFFQFLEKLATFQNAFNF